MDRADELVQAAGHDLALPRAAVGVFDPDDVADLPGPARRLLTRSLAPGVALAPTVVLEMEGWLRVGRWLPFTGHQVLAVGRGMVWSARVGRGPLVVRGSDLLWRGRARLDFRLWGHVPVAQADGPDIDTSTVGRLAAETVAWAPQGLTPAMGARWAPLDDQRAVVTLPIDDHEVAVTVTVDDDGHLRDLRLDRWGDPEKGAFGWHPFGGDVTERATFDGVTIATAGRVGWHRGTPAQDDGEFFAYRVTGARFPHLDPHPAAVGATGRSTVSA